MIVHPYRRRGCNLGAPPGAKGRPGHPEHRGRAESKEAVNLRSNHTTPARWQHPRRLAYAIGRTKPGPERVQALRRWIRAMIAALRGHP